MTAGKKMHMNEDSLRQTLLRCKSGDEQALAALIAWQMPRIRAAATEMTPEQTVEINERLSSAMQGIATRLSSLERQVLLLFLDGASYSTIAQRLNISEKTVDNALQRVRTKLSRV